MFGSLFRQRPASGTGQGPDDSGAAAPGKQTLVGSLLDSMIGGAGEALGAAAGAMSRSARGGDAAPRGAMAGDPGAASVELQRILERGSQGTVEAAHEALRSAQRAREVMQELDHVSFIADDGDYTLDVAPSVTDAMIPALEARAEELAGAAEADPVWSPFAELFNREFAGVLHVFGLERTRDDLRGDPVIAARLQFLFTDEQRALLTAYCETHLIPDRLFDGDDPGRATAQQRIVLASQILADGKYRPGSHAQEVHARACFHWAKIVYQYAGVSHERRTSGLTDSFDLMGGVVLGSGALDDVFHARPDGSLDPSEGHLAKNPDAYRFRNAPWSLVMDLRPGDWLYIYNGNKTGSGAHSVIFAGWAGEDQVDELGRHYRKATTFDQGLPKQGGNRHQPVLGEDMFGTPLGTAKPVNQIFRVDADAMPADSIDDLRPALSSKIHKKNHAFVARMIRKHGRGGSATFDHDGFLGWLRGRNAELIGGIAAVEGRLTPGQQDLFAAANASRNESDVVCLYQRLFALERNSELLADKMRATYAEDLDVKNAEATDAYARAMTAQMADLWALSAELIDLAERADPLREALDALDQTDDIKELRAARRLRQKELFKLTDKARRRTKLAQIKEIDARIAAAQIDHKAHKREIAELDRALDPLEKAERAALRKLDKQVAELEALYPMTDFGLVHTANSQGQIKLELDGRYESLPGVPWPDFVVVGAEESR